MLQLLDGLKERGLIDRAQKLTCDGVTLELSAPIEVERRIREEVAAKLQSAEEREALMYESA
jgi:hypothetical protein